MKVSFISMPCYSCIYRIWDIIESKNMPSTDKERESNNQEKNDTIENDYFFHEKKFMELLKIVSTNFDGKYCITHVI